MKEKGESRKEKADGWERLVSRNAGFIRQRDEPHGPLPDKSGVAVVVSRCACAIEEVYCFFTNFRREKMFSLSMLVHALQKGAEFYRT